MVSARPLPRASSARSPARARAPRACLLCGARPALSPHPHLRRPPLARRPPLGARRRYGVPASAAAQFESVFVNSAFNTLCQADPELIFKKSSMVPPAFLAAHGLTPCRALQRPGQFVVTLPQVRARAAPCVAVAVAALRPLSAGAWLRGRAHPPGCGRRPALFARPGGCARPATSRASPCALAPPRLSAARCRSLAVLRHTTLASAMASLLPRPSTLPPSIGCRARRRAAVAPAACTCAIAAARRRASAAPAALALARLAR